MAKLRNDYGVRFVKSDGLPGVRCKHCGSGDIWRVAEQKGIIAAIMRLRGLKTYQCRGCKRIIYPTREGDED